MKKYSLRHTASLLIAGFAFLNSAFAQNQKTCGTDYMYEQELKKNPSLAEKRKLLEDFTKQQTVLNQQQQTANIFRVIPTVVHVIHFYGAENTSDAQVLNAIQIANDDLKKLNADTAQVNPPFIPIIGKLNIELRLAQKDPNGNCTNGITHTASMLTFSADENVKDLIAWDNTKYLNIWVVDNISFGAGGYAYYPGTAPPGHEGIVVLNTQFGGIGTSCGSNFCARTLTHELGHYFNLPHTWGNSNSCGDLNNCMIDDGVTDTPNTMGNCQTCNLNATSCGVPENVENFMDYSTCSKMYTQGQATRADVALNSNVGFRFNLWQNANLIATGTDGTPLPPCIPVALFKESASMICEGDSIAYTDISWNAAVTSWSWSFPGGIPASSTQQNPVVTYPTPGIYTATLTAGTITGTATFTKTNYIIVSPLAPAYSNWQYYEGFDPNPLPNADWIVRDTNGTGWQSGTVFYSPPSCAYINNYSNVQDDVDELISPSFDATAINNPMMYFKVAYAQQDNNSLDNLRVYFSDDCGESWILRYSKIGAGLATMPETQLPFAPVGISQWRTDSVIFPTMIFSSNVRVKFQFRSKGGNNIYIDDINICGPLGVNEIQNYFGLSVFPNPATANTTVSFNLIATEKVSLKITDVLGKEVQTIAEKEMNAGEQQFEINTASFEKGVYFITLKIGETAITEKLLIQ